MRYHMRSKEKKNKSFSNMKINDKRFLSIFSLLQPPQVGQEPLVFDVHQMRQVSQLARPVEPGELVYVNVVQHAGTGQWLGNLAIVVASQLGVQRDRLYVLEYVTRVVSEFLDVDVYVDEKRPGRPHAGVNAPFGQARPRGGGGFRRRNRGGRGGRA
jgi:hypothetical protein